MLNSYLTYFFQLVGVRNSFLATVIASACQIVGGVVSLKLVTYFGRRPILISGAIGNSLCMFLFAIVHKVAPDSEAASGALIAFIALFTFIYAMSWGPLGPVVAGEIPSNRLRSKTVGIVMAVAWVVCLAILCATPYVISSSYANLGTNVGFIFGGLTAILGVMTFFFLPETKVSFFSPRPMHLGSVLTYVE